ncbi:MAG: Planctomycete cytochrome [Akkermansiaceae bacterium]|nr:Planctomycete cytochrome [Akkermansiaceae bacterium]
MKSYVTRTGLFLLLAVSSAQAADDAGEVEFFEKKIRPILSGNCYSCHAADTKVAGGLRVDDLNGLLVGGDNGPAIVKGDPGKSLLLQRICQTDAKRRMPRDSDPLTAEQIADLTQWIATGAAWPVVGVPFSIGRERADYQELRKTHWAWQPLTKPSAPQVAASSWPVGDVDRFILAKLESAKLEPVKDASPEVLLRRITFDLTGLPPSPAEIADFLKDSSLAAYEKVVDRLLASSAFGERWGRHWLDVARYGESTGPSRNIPYPFAYKYKDYVLDAVNRDLPFDRFIREQIAGDLLPAADNAERDRLLTATGFLALGVKDVNQRFKVRFQMDNVDEQIDTVSRSVLGLTVSCARCHDHKFDPIPATDYYSLAGIFTSTDDKAGVRNKMGGNGLDYYDPAMLVKLSHEVAPPPPEKVAELQARVDEAKKAWDAIRGTPEGLKRAANGQPTQRPFRLKYERLQAEFQQLSDPVSQGYAVHGVTDSPTVADTQLRIRGEAENLGPVVPRGFLTVFDVPGSPSINPGQSGRLELAEWLTNAENPLAPRVAVNRIWLHLFGQGLVSTVDNFGIKGDVPTHPELLDYLANDFIAGGWSTKKLVRELVLTHAYRLGSEAPQDHVDQDPANRLIWRHSPRRMDAEEVRDAILAASGDLQLTPPAEAAVKELRMVEMRDNGREAAGIQNKSNTALHRSIYLPLLRGVIPRALEAFDPVTQTLVTGQRDATTVPTQALFMLNSEFVRNEALASAKRIRTEGGSTAQNAITQVYLKALGRAPSGDEVKRALDFIDAYQSDDFALADNESGQQSEEASTEIAATADGAAANPDDVPRDDQTAREGKVIADDSQTGAWMAFVQSVFASAEFRFIR